MSSLLLILILLRSRFIWSFNNSQILSEQRLVDDIFTNYSKFIRPWPTVTVFVTIDTKKIVSIDEKNQIMTASFYIGQAWEDPRLAWNPILYDNITFINVPASNFWLPDLYVLNTADTDGYLPFSDSTFITLNKDGLVIIVTPLVTANTRCQINTYSFPFDKQKCSIVLSPWSHSKSKIILRFHNNMIKNSGFNVYEPNAIWDLEYVEFNVSSTDDRVYQGNEVSTIDRLNCTLYLKRKPRYYIFNAILPSIIYNLMILLAFFFPFSDQLNICMTCILTFAVDSVRISSDIPIQSDYVPKITIYFVLSFFYNLFSMAWFKVYNYMSETNEIPWLLEKYCEIFRCNCMKGIVSKGRINQVDSQIKVKSIEDESILHEKENKFKFNLNILNRSVLTFVALFMISGLLFLIIN